MQRQVLQNIRSIYVVHGMDERTGEKRLYVRRVAFKSKTSK